MSILPTLYNTRKLEYCVNIDEKEFRKDWCPQYRTTLFMRIVFVCIRLSQSLTKTDANYIGKV